LRVHVAQPGSRGLLFQSGEFSRQVSKRKRFAGFAVVIALPPERPIPNELARARKLMKHIFLLDSRVKAIAIGCLNRSLHGSIITDQMFYCNDLPHQKAKSSHNAIVRAARLQCSFHPCGALQFIRAAKAGSFIERFW
jgi:hypothetical protein